MIPNPIRIVSYNRPDTLVKKTLAFLRRMKVNLRQVTVFVASPEQHDVYADALNRADMDDVKLKIVASGLRAKYNFLQQHFNPGTHVLCIDDDLKDLVVRNPGVSMKTPRKDQAHKITPKEFASLVKTGFETCMDKDLHLWGVYPTSNPMHMRDGPPSLGLKYITGVMFGVIVRRDVELLTHYNIKVDHEMSLRFFRKDGGVVRFKHVGVETAYFGNGGGGLHDKGLPARYKLSNMVVDLLLHEFKDFAAPKQRSHGEFTFKDLALKNLPYIQL